VTVIVVSELAKFIPITDRLAPEVLGALYVMRLVMSGASYVTAFVHEDTMFDRVTVTDCLAPDPAGDPWHFKQVSEVQITVAQLLAPIAIVGVLSSGPKLNPCTVTRVPPPVYTLPFKAQLVEGESYVNRDSLVPIRVPTVTVTGTSVARPVAAF